MPKFNDPQSDRIKQVFSTDEIPRVTGETLKIYFEYLNNNLCSPCMLTGIESMRFFGWEERFEFGHGSKEEYERLRRQKGSYKDIYELQKLDAVVDEEWDILVNVRRMPYHKRFTIPLSELQAVDKSSPNYQLLEDHTVWYVNWRH